MLITNKIWGYRALYTMIIAGLAYFIIFNYATLYGFLIAFKDFRPRLGILGSPWVGLKHFRAVFSNPEFTLILRNTMVISFGKLLTAFPAPILLALLLNELKSQRYKRVVQSILYIPHFISWVIMAGIFQNLFSVTTGIIPMFLRNFGMDMPSLMADPNYFIGFLFTTNVWKTMGWGTIIYLAAISGINPELYESAVIDGCNRFQQALRITLPCISYTIVILLVINMGSIMSAGFDQIFNLMGSRTTSVANIIDTYAYYLGIRGGRFEWATVVGMFKAAVNCTMLFTVNWIAGKISESSPL